MTTRPSSAPAAVRRPVGIDTDTPDPDTFLCGWDALPIVGRSAERAVLSAAYARAAAGEPQVVLITGAAGIGKTRLAEELIREASQAGAQVLTGESAPLAGAALAYGPFVAALGEQAAWLLDDDGPGGMLAARHRLFLRVLGLLGDLAAAAPVSARA